MENSSCSSQGGKACKGEDPAQPKRKKEREKKKTLKKRFLKKSPEMTTFHSLITMVRSKTVSSFPWTLHFPPDWSPCFHPHFPPSTLPTAAQNLGSEHSMASSLLTGKPRSSQWLARLQAPLGPFPNLTPTTLHFPHSAPVIKLVSFCSLKILGILAPQGLYTCDSICLEYPVPGIPRASFPTKFIQVFLQISSSQRGLLQPHSCYTLPDLPCLISPVTLIF